MTFLVFQWNINQVLNHGRLLTAYGCRRAEIEVKRNFFLKLFTSSEFFNLHQNRKIFQKMAISPEILVLEGSVVFTRRTNIFGYSCSMQARVWTFWVPIRKKYVWPYRHYWKYRNLSNYDKNYSTLSTLSNRFCFVRQLNSFTDSLSIFFLQIGSWMRFRESFLVNFSSLKRNILFKNFSECRSWIEWITQQAIPRSSSIFAVWYRIWQGMSLYCVLNNYSAKLTSNHTASSDELIFSDKKDRFSKYEYAYSCPYQVKTNL